MHHLSKETQSCIELCQECQTACLSTASHCLSRGGPHAEQKHIALMLSCAAICETSATFMALGSEQHHAACAVCAQTCDACAESCERLAADDEHMRECAQTCRRCAESCQQMAGEGAAAGR